MLYPMPCLMPYLKPYLMPYLLPCLMPYLLPCLMPYLMLLAHRGAGTPACSVGTHADAS
jgi:hypothetical protein